MSSLFFTSLSGWVLIALLTATAMWPFLIRLRGALRNGGAQLRSSLRLHYWLGYAIAVTSFVHAWMPMSAGWGGRFNSAGLYSATGGWFLIYAQVLLGRALRSSKESRVLLRRCHFWGVVVIATLVILHVALNSMIVQALLSFCP
jgi:cytochrome b561